MGLIFWFSAQPDLPRPPNDLLNLIFRKSAHFGVYGVLALLYLHGLDGTRSEAWGKRMLALVLAALYAISDEYHQSFTPNRSPMAFDVLIDTAGAATALASWPLIHSTLRRIQPSWHFMRSRRTPPLHPGDEDS